MRTTVANLIEGAIVEGKNTTASNGRWKCRVNYGMDAYIVTHHQTDMLVFHGPNSKQPGAVYPLDEGWGSQTDKQGVSAMLGTLRREGYNPSAISYHDLYSGKAEDSSRIQGPVVDTDSLRKPEPDPDLEPFTPPLTVQDTMG